MIRLHGAPLSNYFNMVKTALLEKGIEFEVVLTPPSQDAAYLAHSPMGKIPCLEVDGRFVSETGAILDWIEDTHSTPALLPSDPWERVKVRELADSLMLYVELVGRRGYGALRGAEVPDAAKTSIAADLPKGAAAIARLAKFSPWIAGDVFTYADLVGYFTLIYAARSAQANAGIDLFAAIPGAQAWFDAVGTRASIQKALADQKG